MISADDKFRLADDVRHRRVLDEAVVVRQETNEVLVINEVSASILEFFEKQKEVAVSDLIDHLTGEYEVNRQVLQKDTLAHIEKLLAAGVLVSVV
jgi:Coenzyme PQQ synthesis protein D (PqqD)